MIALLSPRTWVALLAVAALAFCGAFIYRAGEASVRAEWDKERLAQAQAAAAESEARRMKEKSLSLTNEGIAREHAKEKAALVAARRAADDRLRQFEAAAVSTAGADPSSTGRADDPFAAIASECARKLVLLDDHARSLAATASALQNYASRVCLAQR